MSVSRRTVVQVRAEPWVENGTVRFFTVTVNCYTPSINCLSNILKACKKHESNSPGKAFHYLEIGCRNLIQFRHKLKELQLEFQMILKVFSRVQVWAVQASLYTIKHFYYCHTGTEKGPSCLIIKAHTLILYDV